MFVQLTISPRLSIEIEKRKSFSESRRNNAKGIKSKKIEPLIEKEKSEHMHKHMEDENIIIDNTVIVNNIMQFFKFNEIANFDKLRDSSTFVNVLNRSGNLDNFKIQFEAYSKLKSTNPKFTHSFKNFLGTASELFLDGAWNSENWAAKVEPEEKTKANKLNF